MGGKRKVKIWNGGVYPDATDVQSLYEELEAPMTREGSLAEGKQRMVELKTNLLIAALLGKISTILANIEKKMK